MRTKQLVLFFLIGFLATGQAEETKRHSKLWKVSAAVLASVTIADVQSSMGRYEANGLLAGRDGRFGKRGVALKGVLVGAALGTQYFMLKKNPQGSAYAATANFAAAAVTGAVVARNHMVK
jgi:hypothetical protein